MIANLLEYLEQSARRVPQRTAFFDDRRTMTFAQLEDSARAVGTCLAKAVAPRSAVAVLLDARSIENIPAFLGALYAGCAYAPLDVSMPPERLRQLLSLMQPQCVLADAKGQAALQALPPSFAPVIDYERAAATPADGALLAAVRAGATPYDPVSILYTSGSTGIPKGSVQHHLSYLMWTQATVETYGLTEDTVFGNQSPFFYANSIIDIFPPLMLGATVYLLPPGILSFPKRLIACLNERGVTELTMTPSSFIGVARADVLTPGCLPRLRFGIMSGESMPYRMLEGWMQAAPAASWWHFYGSTEMFSVAVGQVARPETEDGRLPVGKPFAHTHILFVDENGREAAPGEAGEMLVSSPWIASGYYRDAERTAAQWVDDPLSRGWQERFYRSGDIGFLRGDGQLMVLGRRDSQIKHQGYRMELGEVEAALRATPGCGEGCVLFDAPKNRIFCFYTGEMTEKELKAALRKRLARYMLPDVMIRLPEMPHTASMKVDRAALTRRMAEYGE